MHLKLIVPNKEIFKHYQKQFLDLLVEFYKRTKEKDGNPEKVLDLCQYMFMSDSGVWKLLFIINEDYNVVGYAICYLAENVFGNKTCMFLQGYLQKKYNNQDITRKTFEFVDSFAKQNECKNVTVLTSYVGKAGQVYEKWIKKYGYNKNSTMFVKEV